MEEGKDGLPVISFATPALFRDWLDRHQETPGLWLKLAKKASGQDSVSYSEALDIALCFGWIDGQTGRYDEEWTLRRFTPRRARSKWSQINCKRVEALVAAGLMEPRGKKEVDEAQADGRWDAAYAGSRTIEIPPDFKKALAANPVAKAFFATISAQNRYAILFRIHDAKKPATRVARIERFVAMLQEGKTLH